MIDKKDGSPGKWTPCNTYFQNGRASPATFFHDNKLYVLGGRAKGKIASSHIQWTEIILEGTDGHKAPAHAKYWELNPNSLIKPIYGHTVEVVKVDEENIVIVLGGKGNDVDHPQERAQHAVVKDDGNIDIFEDGYMGRFPNRWGHGSVFYDNRLYIFGGKTSSSFLDDVQFSDLRSLKRPPSSSWILGH